MIKKLRLGILVLLTIASAEAADTAHDQPVNPIPYTSRLLSLQNRPTVQLPTVERFLAFSPSQQADYIRAFQLALVELDSEARQGSGADNASLMLELLIENAQADARTNFCINLGVVKDIADCDASLGVKMHNFDTKEALAPLGEAATQCGAGAKPCSPAFGFDGNGDLYCSKTNLTATCDRLSKSKKSISLASVLTTCQTSKSPGKAKVDCEALKNFFNDQTHLVNTHCQDSPDTKACGILRNQLKSVSDGLSVSERQLSTDSAARQMNEAAQIANQLTGGSAQPPQTPSSPCPGGAVAAAPKTNAAVAPANTGACVKADLAAQKAPDFENVLDAMVDAVKAQAATKSSCAAATLPNQSSMVVDLAQKKAILQMPSSGGKPGASMPLSKDDLTALEAASYVLEKKLSAPVPADKIAGALYPTELLAQPGSMIVPAPSGPPQSYLAEGGWRSSDGWQIRYFLASVAAKKGAHPVNYLVLGVTPKGETKEQIFPLPLVSANAAN